MTRRKITSFKLPEETREQLKQLAAERGTSQANLIVEWAKRATARAAK